MWSRQLIWIARKLIALGMSMLVVLGLCFILSQWQPTDPATRLAGELPLEGASLATAQLYQQRYQSAVQQLHLNEPKFYFSIVPAGLPDTLLYWVHPPSRQHYHMLWLMTRDWSRVQLIQSSIQAMDAHISTMPDTMRLPFVHQLQRMRQTNQVNAFLGEAAELSRLAGRYEETGWSNAVVGFQKAINKDELKARLPGVSVRWHGTKNQFHHWLMQAATLDFKLSLVDGRSPQKKIMEALYWTLSIHLLAAVLAIVSAVFLGIFLAAFARPTLARWIERVLYFLYAMPVFWIGTLAVTFFTTSTYSPWLDWFPSIGVVDIYMGGQWWERFADSLPRLILPVLVIVLSLLPYLTRQMQQAVRTELEQDYVFFARAKGLGYRQIVWQHVLPNSWFPLLTIVSSLLPWLISGSVTIEYIFNIPGMGRLLYDAVVYQDWPVILALILLSAWITAIAILVVEWLYRVLDPRIRHHQNTATL